MQAWSSTMQAKNHCPATIFIEELKKGIVTDGHGEFLLSDVPAATYTLTVRFIGYHTQTRKLTVGKERGKKSSSA